MWRRRLRDVLPSAISRLPRVRGLGRLVLALDRQLTDEADPASFVCQGSLNGSGHFELDLRAWGQKFAFYYRSWEPEHVAALRRLYRGGTFVDVGSSLGLYVVGLGPKVVARGGAILAVEPVPFNLRRLERNVAINGLGDVVRVLRAALGETTGHLRLHVDPDGADNNAFATTAGGIEVPLLRLDDVLAAMPDLPPVTLMKLDIEGYEPFVLRGAQATLERLRPTLLAEFNRERMAINGLKMQEPLSLLRSLDYSTYHLRRGRLRPLDDPGDEENLFFLPRERAPGSYPVRR